MFRKQVLRHLFLCFSLALSCLFLAGCEHNMVIINELDEREANEIIVFLASKGVPSTKIEAVSSAPGGGTGGVKWGIAVESKQATEAMAILNQNGLPRIKGTNLLELFGKAGLMTSDKEETIRYQAGLAEQIANMIRNIDGVIDAYVQLSFPAAETGPTLPGVAAQTVQKITAAVYVKHQGILDDPNSHLITKIKRLVSASVTGLDINDVTVVSDPSRFTDVTLTPMNEPLQLQPKEYVSIWSIVMSKSSAAKFRFIFFCLMLFVVLFVAMIGWLVWKFYPILKSRGFRTLLHPAPLQNEEESDREEAKREE